MTFPPRRPTRQRSHPLISPIRFGDALHTGLSFSFSAAPNPNPSPTTPSSSPVLSYVVSEDLRAVGDWGSWGFEAYGRVGDAGGYADSGAMFDGLDSQRVQLDY